MGSTATPSGLSKFAAYNDVPAGNEAGFVYGGDLQGNLWRFDINSPATATIGTGDVLKFATLFSDTAAATPQPIMTTPTLGKINGKRVIFVGTGKYLEASDLSTSQKQTIYAIKDDDATATFVNPRMTLVQQTMGPNPDNTASRVPTSNNVVDFYTGRGWYVDLPISGERVNIDYKLVQGTLLFATIIPSSTFCSPGGTGALNYINYKTGTQVSGGDKVSQLYDSPIVGINVFYIQGEPIVNVVTAKEPTPKPPDDPIPFDGSAAGFTGKRVIWRELIQ